MPAFLSPSLQEWRNRSPIVGHECQPLVRGLGQAGFVILSDEVAALPLDQGVNPQRWEPAAHPGRHIGGNVLIEQQPEHVCVSPVWGS